MTGDRVAGPALSCAVPSTTRRHPVAALTVAILAACQLFLLACGGETPPAHPATATAARSTPASSPASSAGASTVVDTGPIYQEGHAVIRTEAVGPLQVGAWRRVAMSFAYALTSFSGLNDAEITPVRGIGKDTVTVVIVNDTVSQIEVMRPGARTAEGIQVGTPLATVRAARGATVGHDGAATTVHLARYCGITFSTADSSAHSGVSNTKNPLPFPADSAVIRTIIVGKCSGT